MLEGRWSLGPVSVWTLMKQGSLEATSASLLFYPTWTLLGVSLCCNNPDETKSTAAHLPPDDVEFYYSREGRLQCPCVTVGGVQTQVLVVTCHVHLCPLRGFTNEASPRKAGEYWEKCSGTLIWSLLKVFQSKLLQFFAPISLNNYLNSPDLQSYTQSL